jgi:hypothetical protein
VSPTDATEFPLRSSPHLWLELWAGLAPASVMSHVPFCTSPIRDTVTSRAEQKCLVRRLASFLVPSCSSTRRFPLPSSVSLPPHGFSADSPSATCAHFCTRQPVKRPRRDDLQRSPNQGCLLYPCLINRTCTSSASAFLGRLISLVKTLIILSFKLPRSTKGGIR